MATPQNTSRPIFDLSAIVPVIPNFVFAQPDRNNECFYLFHRKMLTRPLAGVFEPRRGGVAEIRQLILADALVGAQQLARAVEILLLDSKRNAQSSLTFATRCRTPVASAIMASPVINSPFAGVARIDYDPGGSRSALLQPLGASRA
jgi:hypothetical protein